MADAALRIAENIILLRTVCNKPIGPTRNHLNQLEDHENRALSLEQESDITDCLSFLTAYSDKPGKVMVICVEETQGDFSGLLVLAATNSGRDIYLEEGMNNLFRLLEREATATFSCQETIDEVLDIVISHGRKRLISRLGFDGLSFANQPLDVTTPGLLRKALWQYKTHVRNPDQTLYRMSEELYALTARFADAGHHHSCTSLRTIVKTASDIQKSYSETISNVLNSLQSRWMDPSTKEKLLFRFAQLGKYVPAATRLLKLARRLPLFRFIRLRPVYLSPARLLSQSDSTQNTTGGLLQQYLHGAESHRAPHIAAAIQRLLKQHKQKAQAWQKEIRKTVTSRDQIDGYRVHAEIQLILDCEARTDVFYPPRVIKSSKSACYLCDLFIKLHGGFHTSMTHGRVYDRWMIPDINALQLSEEKRTFLRGVLSKFNEHIEKLLIHVPTRQNLIKKEPRESDIISLTPSTVASAVDMVESEPQDLIDAEKNSSTETIKPTDRRASFAVESSVNGQGLVWSDTTPTGTVQNIDALASPITPTSPYIQETTEIPNLRSPQKTGWPLRDSKKELRDLAHTPEPISLQRGIPYLHVFAAFSPSIKLHIPSIHVYLSRRQADMLASCSSLNLPGKQYQETQTIEIEALWLSAAEAQQVERSSAHIVDLRADWYRKGTEENVLFGNDGLLIRKRGDIVRIRGSYIVT